jgi:hypothetical protein
VAHDRNRSRRNDRTLYVLPSPENDVRRFLYEMKKALANKESKKRLRKILAKLPDV